MCMSKLKSKSKRKLSKILSESPCKQEHKSTKKRQNFGIAKPNNTSSIEMFYYRVNLFPSSILQILLKLSDFFEEEMINLF